MISLSQFQVSALSGMILGDGYLQKTGKKNARLRLEHSARFRDYMLWKMSILPRFFQGRPKQISRIHPITRKEYFYIRVQSNSSPILGKFRRIFYVENRKIIPEKAKKLLIHPIGYVIWFYDDGSYYLRDQEAYLSLGKVTQKEAEIASELWKKIGIDNKIRNKGKKGFELIFKKEALWKLKKFFYWYQVESLANKIPRLPRND